MPLARDRVTLATDVNIAAATTLAVVTGLNWAAQAGQKYEFKAKLIVTGTATVGFGTAISASPTTAATLFASMLMAADAAGTIDGGGTSTYAATGAALGAAGTVTVTSNLTAAAGSLAILEGIVVPSVTQILQLEIQPETATAMVVKAGSYLEWSTL